MAEKQIKPGWKVWRFEQMTPNVNVLIYNPSESGMAHYVGLEQLDPDSLRAIGSSVNNLPWIPGGIRK